MIIRDSGMITRDSKTPLHKLSPRSINLVDAERHHNQFVAAKKEPGSC